MDRAYACVLLLLTAACASSTPRTEGPHLRNVKAFYFGHSLLAGSHASPSYHIPYDIGIFAAARAHGYEAHGQLGWGTPISAHWGWSSEDLAQGPLGFAGENVAPFYVGRNGKTELAGGGYNVVVFTDVNGHARGADHAPVVDALLGLIRIARQRDPSTLAVLYACWNELAVPQQSERAAVEKWRDATLAELSWWEAVADSVNAKLLGAAPMLLVPVSAVVAELAVAAVHGGIPGLRQDAKALFIDDVHGTPLTYYAAAAALYTSIFQEPPLPAASEHVQGTISGALVDYNLPSLETARYLQQRASEITQSYPRAGFTRASTSKPAADFAR